MSETKFTKGPWTCMKAGPPDNTGGFDWCILDVDRKIIAEAFEHVGFGDNGEAFKKRPAKDNANLIAAAPDLYDAAKAVLDSMHMEPNPIVDMGLMLALQGAVKKARGE